MHTHETHTHSAVETITPYSDGASKTAQIRRTFNTIAPKYDFLNRVLSFGIDISWRRKALRTLANPPPHAVLDVATGTGDFALLAASLFPNAGITGLDLSPAMLDGARAKAAAAGLAHRITFLEDDLLHSKLPPSSFDAVTVAFGVRNFESLPGGLRSMHDLLVPDGRLVILELSRPRSRVLNFFYRFYLRTWMPLAGRLLSGHRAEYRYLPASIEAVPQGEAMLRLLSDAGFHSCRACSYTFGICTAYLARA